jgi:hypothetical protein
LKSLLFLLLLLLTVPLLVIVGIMGLEIEEATN